MNTDADQPIIPPVRVKQGEVVKLDDQQVIACDDIAKLALAMHDKGYFFFHRGLEIRFSRDINGGGTQLLEISRKGDVNRQLFRVFFKPTYGNDGNSLYEADLITDQRKDYEPTVNRGKHRFIATLAELHIDWNDNETRQWRSDIERLSRSPETLAGWIEADLEMLAVCNGVFFCDNRAVLTKSDLARHVAAGVSLEDLKSRLTCSKCGTRKARVLIF